MEKNKRGKTCSMHGKIRHVHSFGEDKNFSGERWWSGLNLLRIKLSLLQICWQVVGFHKKAGNFLNSTEIDFLEELFEKYIAVEWLSILLCIQDVVGSDLSPHSGSPDWGFCGLAEPFKENR